MKKSSSAERRRLKRRRWTSRSWAKGRRKSWPMPAEQPRVGIRSRWLQPSLDFSLSVTPPQTAPSEHTFLSFHTFRAAVVEIHVLRGDL